MGEFLRARGQECPNDLLLFGTAAAICGPDA
jgi:hypothetical protein